jgi:hypothetical protein
MSFQDDLQNHILSLEQRPDFTKDMALRRVVELFKEVKSQSELRRQKSLINRVAIDGIESWDTINLISAFLTSHTK